MADNTSYTAKQYYDVEVGSSSSSTTDSMKIGLMYVSEYGFAVSNNYWIIALLNYNDTTLRSNNWLYMGSTEWTISRNPKDTFGAFSIYSTGFVSDYLVTYDYAVRPSFYLTSSTTYVSGSGTSSDPIRIN